MAESSDTPTVEFGVTEWALDPATGDMALPVRILRGIESVAQRIRVRLKWFLGEWFLDQRQGIPYYEDILVKNPDPILIQFIFRRAIESTPGVKRASGFSASLDRPTRILYLSFEATLNDGTVVPFKNEPFIIP